MSEIKIEYWHDNKPYRLNGNFFDYGHVKSITERMQKKYDPFADRINEEGGYIEIHLSHNDGDYNSIHQESYIIGITDALRSDIERQIPSNL